MTVGLRLRVAWYYVRSFFRPTWNLDDYPIVMRRQGPPPDPESLPPPMRNGTWFPCIAMVYGTLILGGGDTPREARAKLAEAFEEFRAEHELPRPGTWGKTLGRLAPHEGIRSHGALRDEFIERVLQLNPAETFVSDQSSLTDFDPDVTQFDRRLRLLYGVELDRLPDHRLVTIMDAIAQR
jgi:hypothetical protein